MNESKQVNLLTRLRNVFDLGETIDYVHLSNDGSLFQFTRQKVEGDVWLIE